MVSDSHVSGIHHVTAITGDVQANVDFYAGFLGLHLVKQTAGFADGEQLHLFYGDAEGRPGSLISFLVWQAAGRGRTGIGQLSEVGLAVPQTSIGTWLTRAISAHIPVDGPVHEFGAPVLRLKDPDGLIIKLVGTKTAPPGDAPQRLHSVTLLTDKASDTADFIRHFGYHPQGTTPGLVQRLASDSDFVDIREVTGYVPSVPGAGIPDHVAFRARDLAALRAMHKTLAEHTPTEVHDRKYFHSLYVRDPAGVLVEYAADGPGMGVDEPADRLGRTLFIPPSEAGRAFDLRAMLPQFARPGEERLMMRDLPFIHRLNQAENPDGPTLVLLHGTGGNEADLMPFARRIAPDALLLGVRGRSHEEGINRWFRRFNAVSFDQADIRAEARAFAGFTEQALAAYGLDPDRMVFIGYSNGANLLAAVMQLFPGTLRRAILIRALQALDDPPGADLTGAEILMLNGAEDPFARTTPALRHAFEAGGAVVTTHDLPAGHELTSEDAELAAEWLQRQGLQ